MRIDAGRRGVGDMHDHRHAKYAKEYGRFRRMPSGQVLSGTVLINYSIRTGWGGGCVEGARERVNN